MNPATAAKDLLVYVPYWDSTIGNNLGRSEYSYFFVCKKFLPLLERFGAVHRVEQLAGLGAACADSRAAGKEPLILFFAPPHLLPLDPPATVVPIFAWEYDTIPDECWNDDPRQNWAEMLQRHPLAITHSNHSCDVVRGAVGDDYPIHALPAPVWDAFSGIENSAWDGAPRGISFEGSVVDSRYPDVEPETDRPTIRDGNIHVELSGIVFTSVLNPHDGRKNIEDLVTAFVWALRDNPHATLVLKLIYHNPVAALEPVCRLLARLQPYQCRVVAISAFLPDDAFHELVRATTFAVNASTGEGQCLPLMEFMSAGKPAIAPNHTAMADYIDSENAILLETSLEWAIWPQDPRVLYRCMRHRLDWASLRSAYAEACHIATGDMSRYRRMSDHATNRLRDHCSTETVARGLDLAMTEVFRRLHVPKANGV